MKERGIHLTHKIASFLVLLAIGLVPYSVHGQYLTNVWTTAEGLPQNSANAIIQTRDGYLWIGTYGGLARFDGISFTQVGGVSNGLRSDRILSLCESFDGGIWIGTEGGGLAKYANGCFVNYGTLEGLKDEVVFTIFEDQDTTLWIGTRSDVQCLRHGKIQPPPFQEISISGPLRSIHQTKKGVLWLNTDGGVYRVMNGIMNRVINVDRRLNRIPAFMYEDTDGTDWFRNSFGLLYESNGKRKTVTKANGLSHYFITAMAKDHEGTYWVGGLVGGVGYGKVEPKKKFFRLQLPDGMRASKIQTIFVDLEGNRWIGTDGEGLLRIKNRLIDVIGAKEGLHHQIVEAVCEDSKRSLWIGTNDGGLYRITDKSVHQFTEKDGFRPESVWSIAEDAAGSHWVGTYGSGVWRYQNRAFKNFSTNNGLTDNTVLALYCARDSSVWMGTDRGGVVVYKDGKFRSIGAKEGLSNLSVRTFLQDHSGAMWIGTLDGLNRYNDGKMTVYTTSDGLSHNYIRSIYEDADSVLWIGTYGGGLNRLSHGRFTRYTMQDGLYDNVVSAILEDDRQNLWMSCNRGIFRVSRNQLNAFADKQIYSITSIAYGTESGMLTNETNGGFQPAAWKTKEGKLLFPTIKGVAVINPEKIKLNTSIPLVHIEHVLVNQSDYPLTSPIEIPYGRRQQIEIHYAALNFTDPQHTQFRFRLEGMHGEWVDVQQRRVAYFSNLSSGEYVFHVVAANNDGIWNMQGASVILLVKPAFWETWSFRSAVLSCLILLSLAIVYQRVRRRRRFLEEQHAFTRQLLDSAESDRKRIAAELHDSLGQELLIIKNRALLGLSDLKDKKNIREQLDEISNTAPQAIQETREIAYNLRPYQIDRLGLRRAIESIINRASSTSSIKFTSDIDMIDNVLAKDMEIHVYRIIQECVNNIIKHANATTASVTIKNWHERLNFNIEDNGTGFDSASLKSGDIHGLGLHGMKERARMLGGIVQVESIPGRGTRILITIKTHEKTNSTNETPRSHRG